MTIIKNERLVKIKAIDWGFWDDSAGYRIEDGSFKPYTGWIYGQVIIETDKYISIAGEVFEDKRARKVTSIPKSVIIEIVEFKRTSVKVIKPKQTESFSDDGKWILR